MCGKITDDSSVSERTSILGTIFQFLERIGPLRRQDSSFNVPPTIESYVHFTV